MSSSLGTAAGRGVWVGVGGGRDKCRKGVGELTVGFAAVSYWKHRQTINCPLTGGRAQENEPPGKVVQCCQVEPVPPSSISSTSLYTTKTLHYHTHPTRQRENRQLPQASAALLAGVRTNSYPRQPS